MVGLPFLALGALVHSASQDVVEQSLRYDGEPSCAAALGSSPCAGAAQDPLCWRREVAAGNEGAFANECEVTLTVEANMTAPVYFYYELHEFFQNQRIYVKSQAARQLRGEVLVRDAALPETGAEGEVLLAKASDFVPHTRGTASSPAAPPFKVD